MRLLITLGAILMMSACGSPGLGDECQGGVTNTDCPMGTFCTLARSTSVTPPPEPNNEHSFCRTICDSNSDCEGGMECRRASGSMNRTCQPTTSPVDGSMSTSDGGM